MKNILVLGGTGFVGSVLCEKLVERLGAGVRCTVPSRQPQRAKHLLPLPGVELVAADVHDEARLATLVAGRDAVINLVAILHGSPADFERAHVALPQRLARVCSAAGVPRIVHVSALGAAPDAPSYYLRSKAAGEVAVAAGSAVATLLRPSVIFGAGDKFMNVFAKIQRIAPFMPLAGADAKFQPVWVDDVAEAIVQSLLAPADAPRCYECAGPQVYTLGELVRLAGRWSGHERLVVPLPLVLGRLQAALMQLAPGEPLMSADNLDSMRVPNVATGHLPGLQALGIVPSALEAIGPGYLGQHQGAGRFDPWRAGAGRR